MAEVVDSVIVELSAKQPALNRLRRIFVNIGAWLIWRAGWWPNIEYRTRDQYDGGFRYVVLVSGPHLSIGARR